MALKLITFLYQRLDRKRRDTEDKQDFCVGHEVRYGDCRRDRQKPVVIKLLKPYLWKDTNQIIRKDDASGMIQKLQNDGAKRVPVELPARVTQSLKAEHLRSERLVVKF